jgi:hypothetical protein
MSELLEIPFKPENGKPPTAVLHRLLEAISKMDGKRLVLMVKEQKRKQSQNQNAHYWGVVVAAVTQMFRDAGNYVDAEDVHEFLKLRVGKLSRNIVTPDGEVIKSLGSTAKLSTQEFEVYLERITSLVAYTGSLSGPSWGPTHQARTGKGPLRGRGHV